MAKGLIYEMAQLRKDSLVYRTEKTLLELNERICSIMEEKHISRSELADKLKTSKAYITKILNGKPNLTIESLEKIALALGVEVKVDLVLIDEKKTEDARPLIIGNTKRASWLGEFKVVEFVKPCRLNPVSISDKFSQMTNAVFTRQHFSEAYISERGADYAIPTCETAVG